MNNSFGKKQLGSLPSITKVNERFALLNDVFFLNCVNYAIIIGQIHENNRIKN